ncbi:MAG TPA: ABC transporter permease, partial [Longimicrobiales bacterium]|nr:ABC transporter permease [Longimicrobiales bacterium]
LPVPEGDRVVRVDVVQPSRGGRPVPVSPADLASLRGSSSLEALGAYRTFQGTLVDPARGAARVSFASLTPEVLRLLRIEPALRRVPEPAEAGEAVLVSSDVWRDLYDADPGALGRQVVLDGVPRTVVGVLPDRFGFPFNQRAWVVEEPAPTDPGTWEPVGRLAPGATTEAATAELAARWSARDAERDAALSGGVLAVRGFTKDRGEGGERVAFLGLVLVALCLLVIACANVANLLLVRATERIRTLGIQSALGASRAQLAGQLLVESLLVAAAGGLLGLVLTGWAIDAVQRTLAAEHFGYFWMRMAIDGRVLAFTGALVVGAALLAGVLPALRVLRADVQRTLEEDDAGAAVGGGGAWSRAFVTAQLALSCGALVAAGLTGAALAGSRGFGRDLPADRILLASVDLGGTGEDRAALRAALEAAVGSVPGVRDAALALGAPGFMEPSSPIEVEGVTYARPSDRDVTGWNAITPGYLDALDIDVLAGRGLLARDGSGGERVAVVNESFVRRFASDGEVLGRRYRLARADTAGWYTVVGVVTDANASEGEHVRNDRFYVPMGSVGATDLMVVARANGDAASLARGVRRAVVGVDPSIPFWNVRTLSAAHAYIVRVPRVMAAMAVGGGTAGLLVAAVGLYGLLAFRLRQRRRELGVRLALGADGARLAREVVGSALGQLVPA